MSENVGASTSGNPMGYLYLLQIFYRGKLFETGGLPSKYNRDYRQ
jgi:hypothetical protein